jgi:sugar lactone lactonase YvrE
MDHQDQLYVAVAACDPANQGIWKVNRETGATALIGPAPSATVLNGIDVYKGYVYAADTFDGLIWRVPVTGGNLELWADHPLLKRPPGAVFPGPNGLRVFRREIYTAVSATGNLVAFPIEADGSAGTPRVHANISPQGCDEFTFDVHGVIYCTTDPFNTVVRIEPDGTSSNLLTAADLLDGPTSVAFGRRGQNRKNLYITNAAFPIFTTTFRPSLMRLRLDAPGAP